MGMSCSAFRTYHSLPIKPPLPQCRILKTWDVRCSRRKLLARGIVKSHFDASRDLTALRGADGDVYTGNSRAIVDVVVHPTGSVAFGIGKNGR